MPKAYKKTKRIIDQPEKFKNDVLIKKRHDLLTKQLRQPSAMPPLIAYDPEKEAKKRQKKLKLKKKKKLQIQHLEQYGIFTHPEKPAQANRKTSQKEELTTVSSESAFDILENLNKANVNPTAPSALFSSSQTIFVVGDGDLSFSCALASYFGGKNLVASCFDPKSVCLQKYTLANDNLALLEKMGASVLFGCDATKLDEYDLFDQISFDRIVFNFPDVGKSGTKEAVTESCQMLLDFFASATRKLTPTGKIYVTLRNTEYYNSWKLGALGEKSRLTLEQKVPFDQNDYPGYNPVRTKSDKLVRKAPSSESALTWIFLPKKKKQSHSKKKKVKQEQQ